MGDCTFGWVYWQLVCDLVVQRAPKSAPQICWLWRRFRQRPYTCASCYRCHPAGCGLLPMLPRGSRARFWRASTPG